VAYPPGFYAERETGSLRSARKIVPRLMALASPTSVVDVGCGTGAWLQAFAECGVTRLRGLDGDWVRPGMLLVEAADFRITDLEAPLAADEQFDLAMSVEVAEHLPDSRADPLVAFLTASAPIVAFSAAVPGQGGTGHVNEQWPEYWIRRFLTHRFIAIDALRWSVWQDRDIDWWYRQNLLLFVHECELARFETIAGARGADVPAVVHPESTMATPRFPDPASLGVTTLVKAAPAALGRAITRRLFRHGS
jgi:SAM-dependent methyltransferase